MDNNLPDKTVLDVSDKFKSILGFKIENITFKRNDFKIESRGYLNPTVSLHLEGKDYVVQDGDVIHFLFNV